MPDTQSPTPETSSDPATGADSAREAGGLSGLKRMSMTAGLGSGDYAAVSVLAVISLVVSLLGGLALVWLDTLVALSVIGVICAIIALRQISRSNGTQTGREFAWVAILIGLAVTGVIVGGRVIYEMRVSPARQEILQVISKFDADCAKADYRDAYDLFSDAFRDRVKFEDFTRTLNGGPGFGNMSGVAWNNEIVFFDVTGSGPRAAVAGGLVKFREFKDISRQPIEFVHDTNGKWRIQDMSMMFPAKKQ